MSVNQNLEKTGSAAYLCEEYLKNNFIDPATCERLGVKRGLRNPTIETLNRIATALDISFYELIGSVEEVPQKQPETNEIKRKIDAQLSSMTLDEQKDILRIIRIFRRRFDEENKKTD